MTTTTTLHWLDAQVELVRLEEQMADLEDHIEKHRDTRREFESCDTCDREYYVVETKIEHHIANWASTWANEAVELHQQCGELRKALVSLIDTFHLDNSNFSRYGSNGEEVVRRAEAAIEKARA
jgi:hypothetical protein